MRKPVFLPIVVLSLLLTCTLPAFADVRLPGLFSEGMVLQEGNQTPVWGWAEDGEKITLQFRSQKAETVARNGKWMVRLKTGKPGGPGVLIVSGKNRIEIKNVLVGEVWICSGQSNMQWELSRAFEPQADIQASANPFVRLFTVPRKKSEAPQEDVSASWQECQPETVPKFSAVAYYFGRALQKARKVPLGLIHTSWGGSPAEAWMSQVVLEVNPAYRRDIVEAHAPVWKKYETNLAAWEKERAALEAEGKQPSRSRPAPPWRPAELYNGMIAPLIPYGIKGAIWYQGETNAARAYQYRSLFPDMIRNWRSAWNQGDFAFLAVQLAPFDKNRKRPLEKITETPGESDWAELREAQVLASKTLKNVGVAVITDLGEKDDIHPTKKSPVGERLSLLARKIAYRERIVAQGPSYKSMSARKGRIRLKFDNVGRGLDSRGGALTGFAISGPDGKFVWAKAEIRGKQVEVHSSEIAQPFAVRYGWADYPVVNLWNKDGLPASPFRTDAFPMMTTPKK